MTLSNIAWAAILGLALTCALPGCATDRKCGSDRCTGDAGITSNVRTLLDSHAELGAPSSVSVETRNHVVYLNGLVNTGFERQIAGTVALQAPGVVQVVNLIAVEK